MEVCELEIGSRLYEKVLELRFELFFQKYNLPREILVDKHERVSSHIVIVNGELPIAYGRITGLGEGICQLSQIVVNLHEQENGYGAMSKALSYKAPSPSTEQRENQFCQKILILYSNWDII